MTAPGRFEILSDLALLLRKHGPIAFLELADFFRDPASVERFVFVLDSLAEAGQKSSIENQSGGKRPRRRGTSIKALLAEMRLTDPEKAKTLAAFHESLLSKQILASMGDMRAFVDEHDLNLAPSPARDRYIAPLMRDLARKPLEEIREMLGGIKPTNLENSALEGWTKIILGNRSIQDSETPLEGGGGRGRTVDPVDPPHG